MLSEEKSEFCEKYIKNNICNCLSNKLYKAVFYHNLRDN